MALSDDLEIAESSSDFKILFRLERAEESSSSSSSSTSSHSSSDSDELDAALSYTSINGNRIWLRNKGFGVNRIFGYFNMSLFSI